MASIGGIPSVNTGSSAMQSSGSPFPDTQIAWNQSGYHDPASGDFGSWLARMFDFSGTWAAKDQYNRQMFLDELNRAFNASEAQKTRDFEKMMSDTSYQRMVEDLKKAGLNPYILMSQGMSGAPSYSGSSAQSSSGNASQANNKLTAAAGLLAVVLRMFLSKGK